MQPYWQKQSPDKPLFPELEWSRPENRLYAGKLLVVGGNAYGFAAPAAAYAEAEKAGIGAVRVLLPEPLQKLLFKNAVLEAEFGPTTPSGSFSQKALIDLIDAARWADGVLLAGDLGRNSETAVLLEKFAAKYHGLLIYTKDAADYATTTPDPVLHRPDTLLVVSLSQLQRLGISAHFERAVTFGMDLLHLVDWLHEFTSRFAPAIVVKHLDTIFVAASGQVSTTKLAADAPVWRLKYATHAAVWAIQNPAKQFEAISTAVHTLAVPRTQQ